jgi:cyanophycinase-like exopeptidase
MTKILTRVVSDPKDLSMLSKKDIAVHFSTRPRLVQIVDVLIACPRLKRISINPSTETYFGKAARKLLEYAEVELLVTSESWGTRHDLHDGMAEICEDA